MSREALSVTLLCSFVVVLFVTQASDAYPTRRMYLTLRGLNRLMKNEERPKINELPNVVDKFIENSNDVDRIDRYLKPPGDLADALELDDGFEATPQKKGRCCMVLICNIGAPCEQSCQSCG
uniref:Uncharacterized protein LOC102808510 n=1 Tax=Saccoglossus kowalevskii TaxID=10224 RepID=A0ABM0LXC1_SACKO|nr:PREDICTED: uncharacterized protein LOC102808510 [Saccoglossus kowalevskii]